MSVSDGDLAQGWTWSDLGTLAEVSGGVTKNASRNQHGVSRPYLRVANVYANELRLDDVAEIGVSPGELERTALREGDLLIVEGNGSVDQIGRVALWDGSIPDCVHQNHLIKARMADARAARFAVYWLLSPKGRHEIVRVASSTSGLHTLSLSKVRALPLALAPAGEQARVVDAIESYSTRLDDAAASLERVQRNLERYRASVLKAAVEGRLVPTEAELARAEGRDYEPASVLLERILVERRRRWEEAELAKLKAKGKPPKNDKWEARYKEPAEPATSELPELPAGWCRVRLDSIADVQLGQQRAPVHDADRVKYPYVRTANITWSGLDLTDVKEMGFPNRERYSLEYGDLLLAEASGSPMEAGKPAIWRDEIPGACYQKTLLRVRPFEKALLLPEYLRICFLNDCFAGRFARLAPGVGIVHITAVRLKEWPTAVPPLAEQHRIVAEVDRLLSLRDATQAAAVANANRAARLRQSILKWAFEGNLVDQDPHDEPASVLLERIKAEREAAASTSPPRRPRGRKRATA